MNLSQQSFEALAGSGGWSTRKLQDQIHAAAEAMRLKMLVSMGMIEQSVQKFEHIAMRGLGLRPKTEIPTYIYHFWAAKHKERDLKAGITWTTGYECWQPGSGFYEDWCKKNERLQYKEAKKCAQSSIIVPATRWTKVNEFKQEGTERREGGTSAAQTSVFSAPSCSKSVHGRVVVA